MFSIINPIIKSSVKISCNCVPIAIANAKTIPIPEPPALIQINHNKYAAIKKYKTPIMANRLPLMVVFNALFWRFSFIF